MIVQDSKISTNIQQLIFISDVHFGVRSNSLEWLEIQKDYFENFLIPHLQSYDRSTTALIIAGDIFDNRQSINLLVMSTALDIFQKIGSIIDTHIILGNHDLYRKSSTDINSVKILKHLDGIFIYEHPQIITFGKNSSKFLMMPWRKDEFEEAECIQTNSADYLVCHTDVKGLSFNRGNHVEHGNDISIMKHFKRVFSGHIHYGQLFNNLIMIGCPYPLTRGDIGNPKGIWKLDLDSNDVKFIANDYSPKFLRLQLDGLLEKTESDVHEIVRNNFVDIMVRGEMLLEKGFPINLFVDLLTTARKVSIHVVNPDDENIEEEYDINNDVLSNFNLLRFSEHYIDNLQYDQKIKDKLSKKIIDLYNRAIGDIHADEVEEVLL